MAKGQMKSNKEARKPKKDAKVKTVTLTSAVRTPPAPATTEKATKES